MRIFTVSPLLFVLPLCCPVLGAPAQQEANTPHIPDQSTPRSQIAPKQTIPPQRQILVVTGSWEPVPLEESDRYVGAYPLRESFLLFGGLTDALDLDSSVQVQGRAPNGVQGDFSIRGGSFEQTLVLLNGIRLSDAQSAHHNLDIPVPLDAIDRVEILHGSGSTLYGSDAVGGVVNVVTRPNSSSNNLEMRLRGAYGSFGTNEESGFLSFLKGPLSQRLSFERELSQGFRDDREYRNLALASESWVHTNLGVSRVFLSLLDRPFGADQFYGNFNSWERTKTWLATVSQDLGKNTLFSLAYRRHADLYELLRDDPSYYTNRHKDDTWDLVLRRHDTLPHATNLYYGIEGSADYVNSNNLGVHSRKRGAVYGDLDVRSWHRFSFSAGLRQEFYGRARTLAVPGLSTGFWLCSKIKLRASVSRAFRLPNYTDLYYHDPANSGDPNLKPEQAMNYEAGLNWHPANNWRASFTVFSRHEKDNIDYIRANSTDIWQAMNFDRLTFTGWEASLAWSLPNLQSIKLEYTGLRGAEAAFKGYQSKYVFNYPTQQAVLGPGYFDTMGKPVLQGRPFNDRDTASSPRVVVVNQTFVRRFLNGVNPLGRTIRTLAEPNYPATEYQITGVVKDAKYAGLREEIPPEVFASVQQRGVSAFQNVFIRSSLPPGVIISAVRRKLNQISPEIRSDFGVLETEIQDGLVRERLMAILSGFFGALAALLAAIGLYGVISYIVAGQRNEIGIRLALGATRGSIVRTVMRRASVLLAGGTAVGVLLTLAATGDARSVLFGIKSNDPVTFVAATVFLATIAFVASFVPARRASRLDPLAALRYE